MRFCQPHWDKLREAIFERGLGDLVAADGETAAEQMRSALATGETTVDNFDPLMSAHWAIVSRISEHAPEVILQPGCPLCWVQDGHEANCTEPGCTITRQTFEDWIPGVADFMVGEWKRLQAEAAA